MLNLREDNFKMPKINSDLLSQIVTLFHKETQPAEGCTEPIAIALAAAKATEILGCKPERMNITVSGNIIKNVKSVIVPNSTGMVGIAVSAAMGAFAGDASLELMVISKVIPPQMDIVKAFLAKNTVTINRADNNLKLYIKIELFAKDQSASLELKHMHTNFTEIIHNGKVLLKLIEDESLTKITDPADFLTIDMIYDAAKAVDTSLIKERMDKIVACNTAIANEGLRGTYGVNIGRNIQLSMERGFYGRDARNHSASVTSAASDARMGGSAMPVMTASGSGNVGLTASLPIITYCKDNNLSDEIMYRGLFFSIMSALHIKLSIGRLSAHCGPSVAAGAVAGALVFINDGNYQMVANAITNTLSGVSGAICDGANSSCAVKIANATYAAFDGAAMAMNGSTITPGDGLIAKDLEATIKNIGELAQKGMREADEVVLDIMTRK